LIENADREQLYSTHTGALMMELKVLWLKPMDLGDGGVGGPILDVDNRDDIPTGPGLYVFSRVHGQRVCPLYIGMAENLRTRVSRQLDRNTKLARGLITAAKGYKTLHIARYLPKGRQNTRKALRIIESALISTALAEGIRVVECPGHQDAGTYDYFGRQSRRSCLAPRRVD
jgi:hypothetical protein